ncbi:wax ester/triacylglycerol synthase domain-containing protein [Streptomyces sp. NPDC005494]|uniref:wax ester/triacylglycerol synthase domain-containing protein n=1 Tax=Streptomyces sp. NPDC005494 TaxID=3364715 RepID=UPI0036B29F91
MTDMQAFLPPRAADLFLRDLEQRAEHPDAGSTIGAVLHLSGAAPGLLELQEHVATRLSGLARTSHLLHGDGRRAQWVHAVPDPARHVIAQRLARGRESLEAAVHDLLRDPWPVDAPAWRLVLLHGHVSNGFALLYAAHHSVQDGATVVEILQPLFGPDARSEPSAVVLRPLPQPEPRPRLRQVLRSAAVLLRYARKHQVWTSPSQPLSSRRRTAWIHAPAASLKPAARAGGASVNAVYLTALGHAIAQWASTSWPLAAEAPIPVMIPVNLRSKDEAGAPGNRLFLTRVDLPAGPLPLLQRLAGTRAATSPLKLPGHRAVLRSALTRLPAGFLQRLVAVSTAPVRLTLVASCLVMRERLRYGDAVVTRIDPLMCCPPGAPLAVVMLVYAGEASVCFRIDRALPDAECLPGLWRQALEDLSTAAGRPPAGPQPATAAAAALTPEP